MYRSFRILNGNLCFQNLINTKRCHICSWKHNGHCSDHQEGHDDLHRILDECPDMDVVEKLVAEDDTIKGIWCVPQYSNPDGYTYSDETIDRFAKMKTAAPDFKIFWDEAYIVHHLTEEIIETPVLLNECKKYGNEDRVFMFTGISSSP